MEEQAKDHHDVEPADSTTPSPQEALDEFVSYTTLHGLHFVISSHFVLRRILWFILITAGLVFLGFQLVISYGKLQANESVVGNKIIYSNEVKFPAFTFCNINMMKKSKIQGTDAEYFVNGINPWNVIDPKVKKMTVNSSFDIKRAVKDHGHTAKDMVQSCIWNGKICSYRNFTTFYSLMYGLCHTFNSGKDGHPNLTSTAIRKENGLQLFIDIQPQEYIGTFSLLSAGIRIFVHDQDTHPMMDEDGIDVMPGFTTNIRLKRRSNIRLKPPFASACGSRKLNIYKSSYSTGACLTECYARIITRRCGCRLLGMPVLPELNITKHCNPQDLISCEVYPNITQADRTLNSAEAVTKHFQGGNSFYPNPNMCDCPTPCQQITFATNLNTAFFPSPSFFDLILKIQNVSSSTPDYLLAAAKMKVREQYLVLWVSYEELNTHEIKERPAYDWSDFASSVGGNLGLFLGCSLLTICEFIDFIVMLFINKYKKTQNNPQGKDNKGFNETTRF